jgi:hypothetical protein
MENKNLKGLIIAIIILLIGLITLGGYVVYEKFFTKEEKETIVSEQTKKLYDDIAILVFNDAKEIEEQVYRGEMCLPIKQAADTFEEGFVEAHPTVFDANKEKRQTVFAGAELEKLEKLFSEKDNKQYCYSSVMPMSQTIEYVSLKRKSISNNKLIYDATFKYQGHQSVDDYEAPYVTKPFIIEIKDGKYLVSRFPDFPSNGFDISE